mmetsp:Transcript_22412/g.36734  ORF Transcript_22412/g.36734 Transcript_22412/m.36734 type:complete len:146 (+) Transcript_22412:277-714(+)
MLSSSSGVENWLSVEQDMIKLMCDLNVCNVLVCLTGVAPKLTELCEVHPPFKTSKIAQVWTLHEFQTVSRHRTDCNRVARWQARSAESAAASTSIMKQFPGFAWLCLSCNWHELKTERITTDTCDTRCALLCPSWPSDVNAKHPS